MNKVALGVIIGSVISNAQADNTLGYSDVVIFGDSLSDGGYFAPKTHAIATPSGKFTDNPSAVYGEILADKLGHTLTQNREDQSGNNFAVGGGARVLVEYIHPQLSQHIPSATSQINHYLDGGIDTDALHIVWIGANDLLAASSNPQNASTKVLSAVNAHAAAINKLHQAGAQYIVMPNLPDMGLTPDSIRSSSQNQTSTTANLYNNLIYTKVAITGANIIPLDTYALLNQHEMYVRLDYKLIDKIGFGIKNQ